MVDESKGVEIQSLWLVCLTIYVTDKKGVHKTGKTIKKNKEYYKNNTKNKTTKIAQHIIFAIQQYSKKVT